MRKDALSILAFFDYNVYRWRASMKAFEVIKDEDGSFVCPYCKAKYKGSAGLYQHFRFKHGLSSKDVYDDLCKKDTDGICIICGKETAFKNGRYLLTCSPECKQFYDRLCA